LKNVEEICSEYMQRPAPIIGGSFQGEPLFVDPEVMINIRLIRGMYGSARNAAAQNEILPEEQYARKTILTGLLFHLNTIIS
jgi:hypothetical protein